MKCLAELRVCAFVDYEVCPCDRVKTSEICNALLCDESVYLVDSVVNVAYLRNDAGEHSVLRSRFRNEYRKSRILAIISRTADTVHKTAAVYVGRICVAVNISLDNCVYRNYSKPSYNFGVIAYLLRSEDYVVTVFFL